MDSLPEIKIEESHQTPSLFTLFDKDCSPSLFTKEHSISLGSSSSDQEHPPSSPSSHSNKNNSKKRKSWGQVLPEPTTNLPPRKRAKTDAEKEQRRVERVLRNRRAAQSSRERKRLEVEALEERNKELEAALQDAQKANIILVEELNRFRRHRRTSQVASAPSPSEAGLRNNNSVTLSQQLFDPQDEQASNNNNNNNNSNLKIEDAQPLFDSLSFSTSHHDQTVNPASLSPEILPVPGDSVSVANLEEQEHDDDHDDDDDSTAANTKVASSSSTMATAAAASSSDLTQHPAAMLSDLQCHLSEKKASSPPLLPQHLFLIFCLQLSLLQTISNAWIKKPLTRIAISLKAGCSIAPSPLILKTIMWLVTQVPSRRTLTLPSSSTTTCPWSSQSPRRRLRRQRRQQRQGLAALEGSSLMTESALTLTTTSTPTTTLRVKLLRKLVTCSPNLARPLMDATIEALRLVSKHQHVSRVAVAGNVIDNVNIGDSSSSSSRNPFRPAFSSASAPCVVPEDLLTWPASSPCPPSPHVLLTLWWTLKVDEQRRQAAVTKKNHSASSSSSSSFGVNPTTTTTTTTPSFLATS